VHTLLAARRHELADSEWSVLEPLLPTGKKAGRPPKRARRQLIDGIRWRTGLAPRGGTSRRATVPGGRRTGCSAAGSGTAHLGAQRSVQSSCALGWRRHLPVDGSRLSEQLLLAPHGLTAPRHGLGSAGPMPSVNLGRTEKGTIQAQIVDCGPRVPPGDSVWGTVVVNRWSTGLLLA